MRGLIITAVGAFLLGFGATEAPAQENIRMGFINSQEIISEAPGAQEAQQQFEREMEEFRREVQQMGEELQSMVEQYEQQQMTLDPGERERREQQIRAQQQEYQERVDELQGLAQQRQAELVEPIMQRINMVIDEIRREGNYTIIFDVAAQGIIAADPGMDLTSEVIRRLRQIANNGG